MSVCAWMHHGAPDALRTDAHAEFVAAAATARGFRVRAHAVSDLRSKSHSTNGYNEQIRVCVCVLCW